MVTKDYTVELMCEHYPYFDPMFGNCEAFVRFSDGTEFVATLFTTQGIDRVMQHWEATGECDGGVCFYESEMLILRRIDEANFRRAVDFLLEDGEFEHVFLKVEPEDVD